MLLKSVTGPYAFNTVQLVSSLGFWQQCMFWNGSANKRQASRLAHDRSAFWMAFRTGFLMCQKSKPVHCKSYFKGCRKDSSEALDRIKSSRWLSFHLDTCTLGKQSCYGKLPQQAVVLSTSPSCIVIGTDHTWPWSTTLALQRPWFSNLFAVLRNDQV